MFLEHNIDSMPVSSVHITWPSLDQSGAFLIQSRWLRNCTQGGHWDLRQRTRATEGMRSPRFAEKVREDVCKGIWHPSQKRTCMDTNEAWVLDDPAGTTQESELFTASPFLSLHAPTSFVMQWQLLWGWLLENQANKLLFPKWAWKILILVWGKTFEMALRNAFEMKWMEKSFNFHSFLSE